MGRRLHVSDPSTKKKEETVTVFLLSYSRSDTIRRASQRGEIDNLLLTRGRGGNPEGYVLPGKRGGIRPTLLRQRRGEAIRTAPDRLCWKKGGGREGGLFLPRKKRSSERFIEKGSCLPLLACGKEKPKNGRFQLIRERGGALRF